MSAEDGPHPPSQSDGKGSGIRTSSDVDQSGVGLYFQQDNHDGKMYVARIVRGSAADRSGVIQQGDVILSVGKHVVEGESLGVLRGLILGPQGTKVQLSFKRKLERETVIYDVELTRGSPEYFESLDRIRDMQSESETVRSKLRQANTYIAELREEIERLRRVNDDGRVKALTNQLQLRTEELRDAEERLAKAQRQARDEERARQEVEAALAPLEAENRSLRDKEREHARVIDDLTKQHHDEMQPLERVIRQQEQGLHTATSMTRDLEARLRAAERELDTARHELQRKIVREEDLRRRFHHEVVKAEDALRVHEEHVRSTDVIFPALHDLHTNLLSAVQSGGTPLQMSALRLPALGATAEQYAQMQAQELGGADVEAENRRMHAAFLGTAVARENVARPYLAASLDRGANMERERIYVGDMYMA